MQHEIKKITSIVNELVTLLLQNGAEDIDVNIKKIGKKTDISIIQHCCDFSESFIDKMRYNLNTQRQCEVEGYYWQLVGEDEDCDELHLVGAMIDEVEVEMINGDLKIHIIRKK